MLDSANSQKWDVDLRHGFRASRSGSELARLPTRKAELLFAMLAEQLGAHFDRSEVAGALWPRKTREAAGCCLRQATFLIRKSFDCQEILVGNSATLALNPDFVNLVHPSNEMVLAAPVRTNPGEALLFAAEWCRDAEPERALDVVASAPDLALMAGWWRYRQVCEPILAQCKPSAAYARVLHGLGVALHGEDYPAAIRVHKRCIPISREFGEQALVFSSLCRLIFLWFESGNFEKSQGLIEIARNAISPSDTYNLGRLQHAEASAIAHSGHLSQGIELLRLARESFESIGEKMQYVVCSRNLGWAAAQLGARKTLDEMIASGAPIATSEGSTIESGLFSYLKGEAALMDRHPTEAREMLRKAWLSGTQMQVDGPMAQALEAAADAAIQEHNYEQGAEYLVRANYHRAKRNRAYSPAEQKRIRKALSVVKGELAPEKVTRWTKAQAHLESLDFDRKACPF